MGGVSTDIFGTGRILSRAQFASVIYNMAGRPATDYNPFLNDVSANQWYTKPVLWVFYWGIASGYRNGNFGVNDNITREQLATMLYNYEIKFKKHSCYAPAYALKNFSDVNKVSSWALDPIRWAFYNKIITANSKGLLDPQGAVTRAECAQIIYNYFVNPSTPPVPDIKYTIKSKNGASVRDSAGTSGKKIGALAQGSVVYYDKTADANGYIWYHIVSVEAKNGSWGSHSGWVANV